MLPREHGAYGQLAFPVCTALAVAGLTWPAMLTAVAAIAAFLGHEALFVRAGWRGPRARRESGARAGRWLIVTAAVALVAGIGALMLAAADVRWAFVVPAVPLAVTVWAVITRREKTAVGEGAVAVTFASVAFPICLDGGAPLETALAVTIAFAALFLAGTLAVRVVILSVRGGGHARAVRTTRRTFALVLAMSCTALVLLGGPFVPWATLGAVAPGLLIAAAVAARPPSPAHLKTLGWTLVLASGVAAATLLTTLRR